MELSVDEAKARLPDLVSAALRGQDVVIRLDATSAVRLQPLVDRRSIRSKSGFQFGVLQPSVSGGSDFLEPIGDDDLRAWEGR